MGMPSGKVVARPMIARACGCQCEFQEFANDRFRTQRLAQFQKTRCQACVEKHNEEQKKAAAALPKKGEALKMLPPGTKAALECRHDGTWVGTLTAGGKTVEATGPEPQGVIVTLARMWAAASGSWPPAGGAA
jgi:hypothetical protein